MKKILVFLICVMLTCACNKEKPVQIYKVKDIQVVSTRTDYRGFPHFIHVLELSNARGDTVVKIDKLVPMYREAYIGDSVYLVDNDIYKK